MDIRVQDILVMKKAHPCGDKRWEVLRTGMDFRLRCLGCGHEVMLHDAARASGMDGHIVSEPPPGTMAERVMTWFGGRKNTPRKNSYLYLDSVDACFFYSNFGTPTVTLTARWSCGAKDLDRLADAAELIKTMLRAMKEQTEKAEAPKNEEAPNA